jgi:hypothetical protein
MDFRNIQSKFLSAFDAFQSGGIKANGIWIEATEALR